MVKGRPDKYQQRLVPAPSSVIPAEASLRATTPSTAHYVVTVHATGATTSETSLPTDEGTSAR